MEESILKQLLTIYGPLGALAAGGLGIAIKLYRDMKTERDQHVAEIKALQDRYITKAETWMDKYFELVKSLNNVLESISSRYDRR